MYSYIHFLLTSAIVGWGDQLQTLARLTQGISLQYPLDRIKINMY
jgi:hypothetical protein